MMVMAPTVKTKTPMSLRILTFVAAITVATASTALAQNSSSGPSSLSETYQDWRVACSGEGQIRRCAFSQALRQQNGQRVLAIELTAASREPCCFPLASNSARAYRLVWTTRRRSRRVASKPACKGVASRR